MASSKPFSPVQRAVILTLLGLGFIAAGLALYMGVTSQQRTLHAWMEQAASAPMPPTQLLDADHQPTPVGNLPAASQSNRLLTRMGWLEPLEIQFKGSTVRLVPDCAALISVAGFMLLLYMGALLLLTSIANNRHQRLLKLVDERLSDGLSSDKCLSIDELPLLSRNLREYLGAKATQIGQLQHELAAIKNKVDTDPLTGLMNRRSFEMTLVKMFSGEDSDEPNGSLLLIRASSLQEINQSRGTAQGDEYLRTISEQLRQVLAPLCLRLYRISGSDFVVINLPAVDVSSREIATQLKQRFDTLSAPFDVNNIAHIGIVHFRTSHPVDGVLAAAEVALATAQTETTNGWFELAMQSDKHLYSQEIWQKKIQEIISKRAIRFVAQPIISINRNTRGYSELYSRFLNASGELMATETVFLMARRLDMIVRLEQLIIEQAIHFLEKQEEQTLRIGINLSAYCVQSGSFLVWLEHTLLQHPELAARIVFEVAEQDLQINLAAGRRLFGLLRRAGSFTAIDKFGHEVAAFRLYKELRPNYIKLGSHLVQQIASDNENQMFVRMMVELAKRMGIWTIAEGVETTEQKNTLVSLYVDGLQGYLIARPQDLLSTSRIDRLQRIRKEAGKSKE